MFPLVSIDVPAAEPAPAVAAMVEACSAALTTGRCTTQDLSESDVPSAFAVVSWPTADHITARIFVGQRDAHRRRGDEPSVGWSKRELRFSAGDSQLERWRAVGFTIATLVGELPSVPTQAPERAAPKPAGVPEATQPSPTERAPAPSRDARRPLELRANLGGRLGIGSDERTRWGGFAGAELRVGERLGLGGDFYADGSSRDASGLSASWLTTRLHASAGGGLSGFGWRLGAGPVLQRLRVSIAGDPGAGATSGQRWQAGVVLFGGVDLPLGGGWWMVNRIELGQLSGGTSIRVRGRRESGIAAQTLTLTSGVSLRIGGW